MIDFELITVEEDNRSALEQRIYDFMDSGYTPFGGVVTVGERFRQEMVKLKGGSMSSNDYGGY